MALYDRLLGRNDAGIGVNFKIHLHPFSALIAEFGRGRLNGAQCQVAMLVISGQSLDAGEVTEINTLLATVTGTTAGKLARAKEIDDVLILAESRVAEYDTPTEVKTRLGV